MKSSLKSRSMTNSLNSATIQFSPSMCSRFAPRSSDRGSMFRSFSLNPGKEIRKHTQKSDTVRKCIHCGTTDTPQWRKGPNQQNSLCNACGLHFKRNLQREKKIAVKNTPNALNMVLNHTDSPDSSDSSASSDR